MAFDDNYDIYIYMYVCNYADVLTIEYLSYINIYTYMHHVK